MEETLAVLREQKTESRPVLFDLSEKNDQLRFQDLIDSGCVKNVSDDYEEQLRELFGIEHPSRVYQSGFEEAFQEHLRSLTKRQPLHEQGRWVYYPWRFLAAHVLPEEEYLVVRTARNRNLITSEEQRKFYHATIGIGGLSVGSSVAFAIALSGGGKKMKLADMDRLALSNTNRVLAGADRLGVLKVEMAARTIYELNPYAEIELYAEGLTPENIESFFSGLDIVVDELDTLAVKYLIREQARKHKIAVVMAADNGDNAVVDIERYDLEVPPPFFHGRIGEVSYQSLTGLDKFSIGRLITKHIGPENVTERMQDSLTQMGKTIVSWPQLGVAALINGAAVAYCVRKILNNQPLEQNRALISLDQQLIPDFDSPKETQRRESISKSFAQVFGL